MVATGICHSDIHLVRGDWGGEVPVVAGHEGAGIVEEVGPGVNLVQVGDHVVVSLLRSCGRCGCCQTGTPHLCTGDYALATESRLRNQDGKRILQGINCATFAEQVVVDQSQLVPVPKSMPLASAALLACGVITGLGAVVNRAKVPPGSSVIVIGVGGVGLNSVQGARLAGAYPIIAMDLLDDKLESSKAFGATHTVNPRSQDAQAAIAEITAGRLADYAFITVGSPAAAEQAYSLVGTRGTIVYVGIPDWVTKAGIPIGPTISTEKTITGSNMGTTRLSVDVPRLVSLYESGRLMLDELITGRYPLDQINEAIAVSESGAALRNVIVFD
jgi:Zn-dependent alcohol dehydrogenase